MLSSQAGVHGGMLRAGESAPLVLGDDLVAVHQVNVGAEVILRVDANLISSMRATADRASTHLRALEPFDALHAPLGLG